MSQAKNEGKASTSTRLSPFQGDGGRHVEIGGLVLETYGDRVSISGDAQVTADKAGLALARDLMAMAGEMVRSLEAMADLPERLQADTSAITKGTNPFG